VRASPRSSSRRRPEHRDAEEDPGRTPPLLRLAYGSATKRRLPTRTLGNFNEHVRGVWRERGHWRIVAHQEDRATGTKLDRPGLQAALDLARDGRIDLLRVYRVDRLSRKVRQLAQLAEELDAYHVTLRSATEPFDTGKARGGGGNRTRASCSPAICDWENRGMLQRVRSPVLIGRQEQLSQLEDALLSVNRGEGRFVVLTGEAGIGKTRLATELTKRARKLGCDVLWGSCSEAELALPYLPFVEAVGNHLRERDPAVLRADLGSAAAELAQLFPQLSDGPPTAPVGDPAQAKLRLFESVVTLLELWARGRGLLLVVDDVHWADSSTRELLDYVARRLVRSRVMILATYRSDELDRRHPLRRMVQVWRRVGLTETIAVSAMSPRDVAEMIAAILNADEVNAELASIVNARAEGNPFVLEEMLKEALDRGEISRTETGWQPGSADALRMPETVRDAVLLRLGRLDAEQIEVLRAAAVLGRSFDYRLLVEVVEADERVVLAALESAVAQQLFEEGAYASDRYSWRHALTQEAIASDTVVPKRQRIHSRAADALLRTAGTATEVARHLLGAGRTDQAVDACLRAAQEAERAVAFREAAELLERVLPHVSDAHERALLLARMGHLRWLNGEPAAAEQLLAEGVRQLDDLGLALEAARARVHLGRCRWELDQPDAALRDFDHAREVLEKGGPSPELALAYLRIAGIHAFQLDYERCSVAAERAAAIAEQASADYERVWALSHVALGFFGTAREFAQLDRCYHEALDKGYAFIVANVLYNEVWDRVHTLAGGLDGPASRQPMGGSTTTTTQAMTRYTWKTSAYSRFTFTPCVRATFQM